jgi:hypothetical protein
MPIIGTMTKFASRERARSPLVAISERRSLVVERNPTASIAVIIKTNTSILGTVSSRNIVLPSLPWP